MLADRTTLNQFLTEERRRHPGATGEFTALVNDVALACKAIAKRVAYGAIDDVLDRPRRPTSKERPSRRSTCSPMSSSFAPTNGAGISPAWFRRKWNCRSRFANFPKGRYLLVFDPLDGSSNIDVNVSVGSIFSILRATAPDADAVSDDFLQPDQPRYARAMPSMVRLP